MTTVNNLADFQEGQWWLKELDALVKCADSGRQSGWGAVHRQGEAAVTPIDLALAALVEVGVDGLKVSELSARLNLTPGVLRHILITLEKRKLVERTRNRGRGIYWGPPGTLARRIDLLNADHNAYNALRAKQKREMRALARLDAADLLPLKRQIVPAKEAAPLMKRGPNSVWELGLEADRVP